MSHPYKDTSINLWPINLWPINLWPTNAWQINVCIFYIPGEVVHPPPPMMFPALYPHDFFEQLSDFDTIGNNSTVSH